MVVEAPGGELGAAPERILVEAQAYDCLNLGDVAMLQVAVERLARLWPEADIRVLTDDPERLALVCPHATPVPTVGRSAWFGDRHVVGRLRGALPAPIFQCVAEARRTRLARDADVARALREFRSELDRADLVVVSGGGSGTDAFPVETVTVLDLLGMAIARGTATAIVGQGFGPLRDPLLRRRAGAVLPRVDFISLREDRASRRLLRGLGVPDRRMITTGDDALVLAHPNAKGSAFGGSGLGFCLRRAAYAGVDHRAIAAIGQVVRAAAARHGTDVVAAPISAHPEERDAEVVASALGRPPDGDLRTPAEVIGRIGRCRTVVTGSYHAGVFALGQGIPVIGLARSGYYVDKFLGLADQFNGGCETVLLDDPGFTRVLSEAIDRAWTRADEVRPGLLDAARHQIEIGHDAYRQLGSRVAERLRVRSRRRQRRERAGSFGWSR